MYCTACGHKIPDDQNSRFCPECGTPRLDTSSPVQQSSGGATASGPVAGTGGPSGLSTTTTTPSSWDAPTTTPGVLQANTGPASTTLPATQSSGSKNFLIAGGMIATIAVLAFGGNQVITQKRNADATATAVSQATAAAVSQATAAAVANARSTSEARIRVENEARETQKQATATARAVLMKETSQERSRYVYIFRHYMFEREHALNNIILALQNYSSMIPSQGKSIYDYRWIFDNTFPIIVLEELRKSSYGFKSEYVPELYETNVRIIVKDIDSADQAIFTMFSAISRSIQSEHDGDDRSNIRAGFEALRNRCTIEIGKSSDRIKSFEIIDKT